MYKIIKYLFNYYILNKKYYAYIVGYVIMNPKYKEYQAGRVEIHNRDNPYAIEEIFFMTKKHKELNAFEDKYINKMLSKKDIKYIEDYIHLNFQKDET